MTTAAELDARYGRSRTHRGWWIGGGIVAVLVVIAASWLTFSRTALDVDYDDTGYQIISENTVSLSFQVTAPRGRDVVCALESLDEEFGIVGWKIVEIPASDNHSVTLTETFPTVGEPVTAFVNSCWVP